MKKLYITFWLPGSGKSTVADYLAQRLWEDVIRISADIIRKKLFPVPRYDKTASRIVWEACVSQAMQSMADGKTIVWDGVFGHEHKRQEAKEMAKEMGYESVFVHVFCSSDADIKTRLDTRTDNPSDADYWVYCALKSSFQHPGESIGIDNSSSLEDLHENIRKMLD